MANLETKKKRLSKIAKHEVFSCSRFSFSKSLPTNYTSKVTYRRPMFSYINPIHLLYTHPETSSWYPIVNPYQQIKNTGNKVDFLNFAEVTNDLENVESQTKFKKVSKTDSPKEILKRTKVDRTKTKAPLGKPKAKIPTTKKKYNKPQRVSNPISKLKVQNVPNSAKIYHVTIYRNDDLTSQEELGRQEYYDYSSEENDYEDEEESPETSSETVTTAATTVSTTSTVTANTTTNTDTSYGVPVSGYGPSNGNEFISITLSPLHHYNYYDHPHQFYPHVKHDVPNFNPYNFPTE
ncbi:hypothetical protein FQA39_LY15478 [Lamprigera yunnana]|nr:hypothetical protein FQA39_LY15478 [Lamprigera yunnana]